MVCVCPGCWSGVWNAKHTISIWESNTRSTRSLGLLICSPISRSACSKKTKQNYIQQSQNYKSWALYYVLLLCAPQTACRRHSRDFCPSPITNLHRVSASHRPASRFIRSSGDTPGISGESGDIKNRSCSGPISPPCGIAEAKALLLHGVFHVFSQCRYIDIDSELCFSLLVMQDCIFV